MPAVTHKDSRHPFEIYVLYGMGVSGAAQIFTRRIPGSIEAVLPPWLQLAWALMLLIGSIVALVGIFLRDPYNGLILESLGLLSAGFAAVVYGGAVLYLGGFGAAFAAATAAMFGLACLTRRRQIEKVLKPLRRKR